MDADNKEIFDLAARLIEKLEEAGYSTVNSAGYKDVRINVFDDQINIVNFTSNPPLILIQSHEE